MPESEDADTRQDSGTDTADKRPRGRPRGSGSKRSGKVNVQAELLEVYRGLGGAKAVLAWAEQNPKNRDAFYKTILPKIMQKESEPPESKREFAGGAIIDEIDAKLRAIKDASESTG